MSQVPSSPDDRKKIHEAMKEISNSLTRIDAERDLIKETIKDVSTKYAITKRAFRRLVKVYHTQTFNEEVASHEEFETLYESIVK